MFAAAIMLELYTIPVSNLVSTVVLQYLSVRRPARNFFSPVTARFVHQLTPSVGHAQIDCNNETDKDRIALLD
jgi:hypothetical protein